MPDLVTVISSLGLSGALIWLSKSWVSERLKDAIKHEYDQKLVAFEAQLKSESECAIERLRSQLQVAAAERNVRYTRIFERTAETVAETYAKLVALGDAVAAYTRPLELASDPPQSARRKMVWARYMESFDYFRPRRIFLPTETADQIERFHQTLRSAVYKFACDVEGISEGRHADLDVWNETVVFVEKELPKLRALLEGIFGKSSELPSQTLMVVSDEKHSLLIKVMIWDKNA